ncbi:hypothetical protein I4U23_003694 [Adineta vaga]|nr:hypothetical protein I4U23_003694 [Adineta vaga]
MDNQEFRGILLKLQDRLSDNDRKRLHFFFGNDVPRRIRDDPTLGGTLSLLESLFDQDKINEQDFSVLVNALEEICCSDAAKLLKDHMKQTKSYGTKQPLERLSSIMPSGIINDLLNDLEEDRCAMKTDQYAVHCISNINAHVFHDTRPNISPPTIIMQTENKSQSKCSHFFIHMPVFQKYLVLVVIIFFITSFIFLSLFIQKTSLISALRKNSNTSTENDSEMNKTIQFLNKSMILLEQEKNQLPIRSGTRFCGVGGGYFDDSLISNFTCSHHLRGMSNQHRSSSSNWFQFHYSSMDRPSPILKSDVHGAKKFDSESDISEQFYLDRDDVVYKIQVLCRNTNYYKGDKTYTVSAVRAIRLFTKKERSSAPIEDTNGDLYTEQFDGYYVAYATGLSGIYLDQIQFYWTRAAKN